MSTPNYSPLLLTLPPEILDHILSSLSSRSVCRLEMCSQEIGVAVIKTNFWRKKAESLMKHPNDFFVRNLMLKVEEEGYESEGGVFKMIVRARWKLNRMVKELKTFSKTMRQEFTDIFDCDHSEFASDENCLGCEDTTFFKSWNLEIIPEEKKAEFDDVVNYIMDEGIEVIRRDFVQSKKGPEPILRSSCFEMYKKKSGTEIVICCSLWPIIIILRDCIGEDDYESGESDSEDDDASDTDYDDEESNGENKYYPDYDDNEEEREVDSEEDEKNPANENLV